MHKTFTKSDKFSLFMHHEGAHAGAHIVNNAALGAVMGIPDMSIAIPTTLAVLTVITGFNAYAMNALKGHRKKIALNMYREEVAALQGKPVHAVTVADLENAAKPVEQGGMGIAALKTTLDLIEKRRNYTFIAEMATSGLMALGLMTIAALGKLAGSQYALGMMVGLAGASTALYGEVFKLVESGINILTGLDEEKTVTADIRDIAKQISLGGRISSTRVMGVYEQADPQLRKEITERYGDEYDDLTISQKRKVVKDYDAKYHIYALTKDINDGCINPTELAFMAYNQRSGVKRCAEELNPYTKQEEQTIAESRWSGQAQQPLFELQAQGDTEALRKEIAAILFAERLAKENRSGWQRSSA